MKFITVQAQGKKNCFVEADISLLSIMSVSTSETHDDGIASVIMAIDGSACYVKETLAEIRTKIAEAEKTSYWPTYLTVICVMIITLLAVAFGWWIVDYFKGL